MPWSANPSRIKVFSNRVMIYLNGKRGGIALCSIDDLEAVRGKAWYLDSNGYAQRSIQSPKRNLSLHRELLGAKPGEICDHINNNKLDNRRCNLRIVSKSMNNFNRDRGEDTGIYFDRNTRKWIARLNFGGTQVFHESFTEKSAALKARRAAELEYVGEHRPRLGMRRDKPCH